MNLELKISSHTHLLPSKIFQNSRSQSKHTLMCSQTTFSQGQREIPTKLHSSKM